MENVKNPETFWASVTVRISSDTHYSRAPSCLLRNRHRNRRPSLSRAAFVCRAGLLCDNGHTRSRLERHGGGGENGLNLCNIFDAPLKPGVHTNDFATIHGRPVRIHTAPAEDNTSNQQSTPQALCEYGRSDRESWRNR